MQGVPTSPTVWNAERFQIGAVNFDILLSTHYESLTESRMQAVMLHQQTVVGERAILHLARGQFMMAATRLADKRTGLRALVEQLQLGARFARLAFLDEVCASTSQHRTIKLY